MVVLSDTVEKYNGVFHMMSVRKALTRRMLLSVASVATVLSMSVAHAQVYKFEQEDGTVTYGDRTSLSPSDSGHSVLNSQGVVLKKVMSREERRQAARQQALDDQARLNDKTLLATFTTEDDLLRTRKDRLGAIDGQMERLDERVRLLNERKLTLMERIQEQEQADGKGNAQDMYYVEQKRVDSKIESTWSLIDAKSVERKEVSTKFDNDLKRYRELKSGG